MNALLTGHILTDRQYHIADLRVIERSISYEKYFAGQAEEIPQRQVRELREIGEAVAFLTSERASCVAGVSLQVESGVIEALAVDRGNENVDELFDSLHPAVLRPINYGKKAVANH